MQHPAILHCLGQWYRDLLLELNVQKTDQLSGHNMEYPVLNPAGVTGHRGRLQWHITRI
jgi:hypothetical protein